MTTGLGAIACIINVPMIDSRVLERAVAQQGSHARLHGRCGHYRRGARSSPTNPSQTTKHRSNTPPPVPRFPVPFEVIGNVYVLHHGVTTEITQL
jgi:hypothetical protein